MPALLATKTTFSPPTRVLPRQQPATVTVTQTMLPTVLPTSDDNVQMSSNTLNGGAIAGIVIGSIVALLLILWLLYSCTNFGAPPSYRPEDRRWHGNGGDFDSTYSRSPHRHHHHSRHHHHHHPRVMREVSESRTTVRPTVIVADESPRRPSSAHYHQGRGRSLNARD